MQAEQFTKAVKNEVNFNKTFNKIFCVGANKTGTTTLEFILKTLGFSLGDQLTQEARLTRQVLEGNYTDFYTFCSHFDAFQDLPFSKDEVYIAADVLFPGSKFILTERPAESWFNSMYNFHKKVFSIDDMNTLTEKDVLEKFMPHIPGLSHYLITKSLAKFEGQTPTVMWDKLYDKDTYIAHYEQRNERIKKYFMNRPDDFLTLDITQEKTTNKICKFLGVPEKFVFDMPHINKT
tara:strand:+ start:2984 stop:3688 length:705 start_codon:yes stop_codon:yes gene_type:complete